MKLQELLILNSMQYHFSQEHLKASDCETGNFISIIKP